jgi:hypothetical protein
MLSDWGTAMRGILTTLVFAASLLVLVPTSASAWVCVADGFGASASARSKSITTAKLSALRACERKAALRICTIRYCR